MWIFFALITAFITSVTSVIYKRLSKKTHYLTLAIGQLVWSVPFFALFLLWYPIGPIEPRFWVGLVGTSILNVFAVMFAFRTIYMEDISFLAPIAAFNPILTMLLSFFTLGEIPSLAGIMGVVTIGIGASFLGYEKGKAPQQSLIQFFRRRSVRYALFAQVIWAVTPTFEKIAMQATRPENPALLALLSAAAIAIGMVPFMGREKREITRELIRLSPIFVFVGFISALSVLAAFTAYLQANLGYATAVFRMNIFFTIILAAIFLKEKIDLHRMGAAFFMFLGIILLSL